MDLHKTFFLNRASRYANPAQGNDRLPIVYGDLTDGSRGVWAAPCIQQWNGSTAVYCYAGHETLSVANGNNITVYSGDNAASATWTFSESNNFESNGVISTITFTTDQSNNVISVQGMGKPTASGGSTLMENIIDIANDFLVTESGALTAFDYNDTEKARSSSTFDAMGYTAAGVIDQDVGVWDTIYKMMASFNGDAYVDANGELVLRIRTTAVDYRKVADVMGKGDIKFVGARLRADNLVNRIPCTYAYNYVKNEFSSRTDASGQADTLSINIYGERLPTNPYQFYWTRNVADVQSVQSLLITRHKDPSKIWEVSFEDNTLKRAHVEVGDYVIATFDLLYDENGNELINQYFEVIGIDPDFNRDTIKFRCLNTGVYLSAYRAYDGLWQYDGAYTYGADRDTTVYS